MQLISKFNKGFKFSLCDIDIYSKYAWVTPLKDKETITITGAFQKIFKEFNRRQNRIWVDKGSELYNRSVKSWLEKNVIEMYSTHNKGKPAIAERFIVIVKNKTYKCMAAISKNVYINKLNDVVHKCNNTCHSTIKIKPADVKSTTYIDSSKEINDKSPKLKIGDTVRIAKYKKVAKLVEHFMKKNCKSKRV